MRSHQQETKDIPERQAPSVASPPSVKKERKRKESKTILISDKNKRESKMPGKKTVKKEKDSKCDKRKRGRPKNSDRPPDKTSDEVKKPKRQTDDSVKPTRKRKSTPPLSRIIKIEMDSPPSPKKPKSSESSFVGANDQSKLISAAHPKSSNEKSKGATSPREKQVASAAKNAVSRQNNMAAPKKGSLHEQSKRPSKVLVSGKDAIHSRKDAAPVLLKAKDVKKEVVDPLPPKSHPQRMASLDAMARMHVLCTTERRTPSERPKAPLEVPKLAAKMPFVAKKEAEISSTTTTEIHLPKRIDEVKKEHAPDSRSAERSPAEKKKASVDKKVSTDKKASPDKKARPKQPSPAKPKAKPTKQKEKKPNKMPNKNAVAEKKASSSGTKTGSDPKPARKGKVTKSKVKSKEADSLVPETQNQKEKSVRATEERCAVRHCCIIPFAHMQCGASAAASATAFSLHRCLYSRPDCGCCCPAAPLCVPAASPFPCCGRCLPPDLSAEPRCCRRDLVLVPRCFGCGASSSAATGRRFLLEREESFSPCKKRKFAHGWDWAGSPVEKFISLTNDSIPRSRQCYPAVRHREGDLVRERDCVLLKSGPRDADLPYVAKVAAFWENPDDGEMMMSLLWYYRPEHTEQGRAPGQMDDEVFASKHRDTNSVACIEDKCYVLTFAEYCRYRAELSRGGGVSGGVAPGPPDGYPRRARLPPVRVAPDMVLFCRSVYDFRQKRLLKNPS